MSTKTVALMTSDMKLIGYADLVFDKLTQYLRYEVGGIDMVFERTPSVVRHGDETFTAYRCLDTYLVTNFRWSL